MTAPLSSGFSAVIAKKMEIILEELGIQDDALVCSEAVEEKYINLKLLILRMLCIDKHLKMTNNELTKMKEKSKDLEDYAKIVQPTPTVRAMHHQ